MCPPGAISALLQQRAFTAEASEKGRLTVDQSLTTGLCSALGPLICLRRNGRCLRAFEVPTNNSTLDPFRASRHAELFGRNSGTISAVEDLYRQIVILSGSGAGK